MSAFQAWRNGLADRKALAEAAQAPKKNYTTKFDAEASPIQLAMNETTLNSPTLTAILSEVLENRLGRPVKTEVEQLAAATITVSGEIGLVPYKLQSRMQLPGQSMEDLFPSVATKKAKTRFELLESAEVQLRLDKPVLNGFEGQPTLSYTMDFPKQKNRLDLSVAISATKARMLRQFMEQIEALEPVPEK